MKHRSTTAALWVVLAAASPSAWAYSPAQPQTPCASVESGWGALGTAGAFGAFVVDQVVFDDGSGPALFACGRFDVAGSTAASKLAKWDGASWTAVGAPPGSELTPGDLLALAVYDDGSGPALYVGGFFLEIGGVVAGNLARWDGGAWHPVGGGYARAVNDLLVFDDGGGAQLYVAGNGFTATGGAYGAIVSRWNGASWSTPGGIEPSPEVKVLCAHDDGSGPALYVGGQIATLGATPVRNVVRWNGAAWSELGGGANGRVLALAEHDDGGGKALFIGGEFDEVGGMGGVERVARWRGGSWSALGAGLTHPSPGSAVHALAEFDDGGGPALFAAGLFVYASGAPVNSIARWRSGAWSALGSPVGLGQAPVSSTSAPGRSLLVHDDASGVGPALFVAGHFGSAGGVAAENVARWNSTGWTATSDQRGADSHVEVLAALDLGAGEELYVGGRFNHLGATAAEKIGKGDGASWSSSFQFAIPNATVRAIVEHDDGGGRALYIGGDFQLIDGQMIRAVARWDGTQWSALPGGPAGGVRALATFDDGGGPALWAAGTFTTVGGAQAWRVVRWRNGAWSTLPSGPNGDVYALAVHDDGSGPALYCGGAFSKIGSTFVFGVARWNGTSWSPVANGFTAPVRTLRVLDLGQGAQLFAGGDFEQAPPFVVNHIARWDGSAWRPLGAGFDAPVTALEVFDDGAGTVLYAGGDFAQSGASTTRRLARWDGAVWSEVGDGFNGRVSTLAAFRPAGASSDKLFVGGYFTRAGASAANHVVALELACPCPPASYCTSGVSSNGCMPAIHSTGTPSASGATPFTVGASGVDGQRLGVLFYGVNGRAQTSWGATSSLLCVKPPHQRTSQHNSGGTAGACDGALGLDWNAYHATHPAALGAPFQAGDRIWIQGWYRDPANAKTTSLTDALEFLLCP